MRTRLIYPLDLVKARKTREQLEYSRLLDVHKWSQHLEVNRFVYAIWGEYFRERFDVAGRGKRPKQHPKYQLKVLLLDLYVAWKTDPDLLIGVGMSKADYKAGSRYNEIHISAVMIDLINHAAEQGLIEKQTGSESSGLRTRIWPTNRLIDEFRQARFASLHISNHEDREVIVLNSQDFTELSKIKPKRKSRSIEYNDSDFSEIQEMRRNLNLYNELLNKTFIDIPTLQNPVIEKRDESSGRETVHKIHVDQASKFVRRIFYRGSWNKGGRFHGGWWQQIPKEFRQQIYIDDISTLEMDYSGLHVNLLYGLKGVQPVDDPYTVETLNELESEEQRKYIKSLALMAINAESENKAFQAFRNEQPTGSIAKRYNNKQLRIMLDAFKEKNFVIRDDICTDIGVQLMNIDGKITSRLINHFTRRDIPILTIHDSYIVQNQYSCQLVQEMNRAATEELRFQVRIDEGTGIGIDQIRAFQNMDRTNARDFDYMYQSIPNHTRTEEYNNRLRLFNEYQEEYLR